MSEEEKKAKSRRRRRGGSSIVTKESVCAVFAVFSLLAFLILCTNEALFGSIGGVIHGFLTGVFGYMAYPVLLAIFYLSFMGLIGKRLVKNRKAGACITLTVICIALIVHSATTFSWELNQGYLSKCFHAPTYETSAFITVGGIIGALPVLGLAKLLTMVGTLIVLSLFALLFGYLSYAAICGKSQAGEKQPKKSKKKDKPEVNIPVEIPLTQPVATQPQQQVQPVQTYGYATVDAPQQPGVVIGGGATRSFSPFSDKQQSGGIPDSMEERRKYLFDVKPADQYKNNLIFDPNSRANNRPQTQAYGQPVDVSYTEVYQDSVNQQATRPEKIVTDFSTPTYVAPVEREIAPAIPQTPPTATPTFVPVEEPVRDTRDEERGTDRYTSTREVERDFSERSTDYADLFPEDTARDFQSTRDESRERRSGMDIFDENEDDPYSLRTDFERDERTSSRTEYGREESVRDSFVSTRRDDLSLGRGRDSFVSDRRDDADLRRGREDLFDDNDDDLLEPTREERVYPLQPQKPVAPPPEPPKPRIIRPYQQPRLDDFTCTDVQPMHDPEEEEQLKRNIIGTLADFKIYDTSIASTTHGPTVTRYNVSIPRDIPPQKVLSLEQRIAMSLHSSLISVLPNYDCGTISIEVPNKNRQFVNLGSMLSGDTFVNAKPSSLVFAMGKDVSNAKVYGDFSKMVHLLVAGGTGGGKSVFLGAMIMSLIYKYSPEQLRLILIDPKKTEFSLYYNLPHLMINEIITDSKKTVRALSWADAEMNRRYDLISQMTKSGKFVQNIDQYNDYVEKENKLPKLVIIIDELADLMLTSERKEIEDRIQSLTQKARAAGIHVVVATQRPSINVITGVIKTNLLTRIAFAVPSDTDSRVILDNSGAQNLCGLGDMLYFISGMKSPIRVQSPFISNEEAQRIVNYIKENNEAYYDEDATAYINDDRGGGSGEIDDVDEFDPVYIQALRFVIASNTASISLVQRKCSVGYNKAGKIIDWMDNKGYITPFDGAKARKVLITKEQFEDLFGPF